MKKLIKTIKEKFGYYDLTYNVNVDIWGDNRKVVK